MGQNEVFAMASIGSFLEGYADRLRDGLRSVDRAALEQACEAVRLAGEQGRHVYAIGNGGSAAIADHLCCDLTKGADTPGFAPIVSTSLAANMPLYSAIANDLEFAEVFARQIDYFGHPGDVLIAVSSSGNSENIVRAVRRAKERGLLAVGLSGFSGGALRGLADISLHVPVDNYGVVEDAHQALMHIIAQFVTARRNGL